MDLHSLSVLLVDDNELDARQVLSILRDSPFTTFKVKHARTCAEALEFLQDDPFDCILLDLSLPDASGLESLDTLSEAAPQSPIVLLTGLEDPRLGVGAVERGAHDFLPKGRVDGDLVVRAIRYAVTRHHSELSLRAANEKLRIASERERIARDLQDTVVQQLFAAGMSIQAGSSRVTNPEVRDQLMDTVDSIDDVIKSLRQTIFELGVADEDQDASASPGPDSL